MSAALAHRPWVPFALLAALWVVYTLLVVPLWGWTYWDFGDGNYMYIARRVREGLVLYRDILAPQPPLHTLSGVVVQELGALLGLHELTSTRVFTLLVRFAQSLMILLVAWRFFGCPFRGITAAALYLALPIGFWWSLCYQSENLEMVFLLLGVYWLMAFERNAAVAAGVAGALACQCNMTGVPFFLANAVFLAFRVPRLLPWYAGAALGVYTVTSVAANIWTDGYFLDNVVLNQAGTFPRTDILAASPGPPDSFAEYAYGKVLREAWRVIEIEWGMLLAMLAGLVLVLRRTPSVPLSAPLGERIPWLRTEFLAWTAIGMLLTICFTMKGGTVNYIFVLGEPAVALFAAEALVSLWRASFPPREEWRTFSVFDTRALLRALFPLLATGLALAPGIGNIRATLSERQAELPEREVNRLREFIETYAAPGDRILAPPFYAFATDTVVAGEIAENYIWNIKYRNELFDAEMYGKETGKSALKMDEVAALLRNREVAVVLLDMDQTGTALPIAEAIDRHYQPAEPEVVRTRNTRLGLFVPRGVPLAHRPLFGE